jgi:hypothetical protein
MEINIHRTKYTVSCKYRTTGELDYLAEYEKM